jgi:hypothetical protein
MKFVAIVNRGAAGFWNLCGQPTLRLLAAVSDTGYRSSNGVLFKLEPMDGVVPNYRVDQDLWTTRYRCRIEAPDPRTAERTAWDEFGIGSGNSTGLRPVFPY